MTTQEAERIVAALDWMIANRVPVVNISIEGPDNAVLEEMIRRAAERGHHLVVGRLLRAGIDKDHVNRIGYQAVHEAVWFGADGSVEVGRKALRRRSVEPGRVVTSVKRLMGRTLDDLKAELKQAMIKRKRETNPGYGTIRNIGNIFSDG